MSKLIFTNAPTDNNTDASDGKAPSILTPSTVKKGHKCNPANVSFAKAIITKQTANISPSNTPTSQLDPSNNNKDDDDDIPPDNFDGTMLNKDWQDNDQLPPEKPKQGYMVVSQATDGPFTKACVEICHGLDNFTANTTIAVQANQEVISNEGQYYPDQRVKFIGKQPAPFAFLAITSPNNQVVVLHGIRYLKVPFCFKHDHDGHILAFCNYAEQQGGIPQIV